MTTSEDETPRRRDWVATPLAYALAWGLPSLALIAAAFAPAGVRTAVWAAALVWMGLACLANARRCGRVHCRYTGPFFLASALAVGLYGTGVLPLGARGWWWLGAVVALGGGGLWAVSEGLGGRYRRDRRPREP